MGCWQGLRLFMTRTHGVSPYDIPAPSVRWLHWKRKRLSEDSSRTPAKPLQSCPTLCNTMDCHPPGSSVYGILQARIPEWVAMPSSRVSSLPRDRTSISYLLHWQDGFFTTSTTWEALLMTVL